MDQKKLANWKDYWSPMNEKNMTKAQVIEMMNQRRPTFLNMLGGEIKDMDVANGVCTMHFDIGEQFCHSVDIIQGGFVTTMMDSVSAHAVFGMNAKVKTLSSLELKVSFLAASRKGKYKAVGKVEKLTRNFAFLTAELFNDEGERTATLSSTAKISYHKDES